jgi:Flp pilus assembly pilin Flp
VQEVVMVLLWLYVRLQSFMARLPWLRREEGQTTAEYALVILAAVAVAVVLIAWARSSGKLPSFFDKIIDQVSNSVP